MKNFFKKHRNSFNSMSQTFKKQGLLAMVYDKKNKVGNLPKLLMIKYTS